MSDYVVYHKAEKMGYPALDIDSLAIYTKKRTSGIEGSRIWLVAGQGDPRQYYLRATFLISAVEDSDKPSFTNRVTGKDGQLLDPMPLISDQPWFSSFLQEQGHFAFGFNKIKNSDVLKGLKTILLANTLR
ncbi:hypothetical protein [Pigmentiphaga sp. NML080357]|uniref:hypothetical protein n=1 Tax=Pigmentiphaga sp. NML080357 TaxID=2008675 RepID=UPI001185ABBD|nr:hypothetical protein [Pigmentiphaga sp. NML080357]